MSPRVRSYDPGDREAVIGLWDEVFADDPPWNQPELVIDSKIKVQADLFFVCEIDGSIVGTVLAGFDGHRGWVHKVATDPRYRRKGIARLLMEAAERGLASKGCKKLNLQVRDGNDGAVAFYKGLGFAEERRVSMSKHLSDSDELSLP